MGQYRAWGYITHFSVYDVTGEVYELRKILKIVLEIIDCPEIDQIKNHALTLFCCLVGAMKVAGARYYPMVSNFS